MVCGIDEAGRGSLCGSMFVAGVACDQKNAHWLKEIGVKDSKKLSKPKRFELASKMQENKGLYTCIVQKSAWEIDTKGLSLCLRESIEEIISHLLGFAKRFCVDGNTLFGLQGGVGYSLEAIIKGDDKIPQISGASILAKTSKDAQMIELDEQFPQYGFKNNAGYGTSEHLEAIRTYGQTYWHRKSFVIR
ncbi:ribonuclease HII [Helicobacter sp. 11S03491-1]|uniref:ribonuclease HII n=1 Tax=Helicobacter sp. 11S03491-1 TaxID=1476196 RepID=UPI000BA77476|nr:ribonuclease HII [Helicobacter sp. 11S03491-1]PAF41054.1 hypothetical protein BKH45_08530 [Helicobacter sp. 11S03491-1]